MLSDDIEIANIGHTAATCDNLQKFPVPTAGAVGGLDYNDNPLICGGEAVWVTTTHLSVYKNPNNCSRENL